jgi:tetratricopeptide (TPR) repeat protein
MRHGSEHHVFVSYSRQDLQAAERVARILRDAGLPVWFEAWNIAPGMEFGHEVEEALANASSIVVFVGPSGLSKWQQADLTGFLHRQPSPVIPVLLPGAEPAQSLNLFRGRTWVDLRGSPDDDRQLSQLVSSILRLEADAAALEPDHSSTAVNLSNFGLQLIELGDLAGAQTLYQRALAITERALGPNHPNTATSLNNLASILQSQGNLSSARRLFERALAIREKVLGPDHPDTATSLNNLALLLKAQGDLSGARRLFERALAIYEKVLGPDHPDTATSLNNLALLLKDQNDLVGARRLFERALAIYEKALGPEHPNTVTSSNNLALLLQAQSDLATARSL